MSKEPLDSDEIRRFEDQFRRNPDSLVFARLADAHRKAGDPNRALEILEAGIGRHGGYPSAHIVRARTYMDLGQPGAAEQSFLRAIDLDASNLVAMRGLASLAQERGDEAAARMWFQRISGLEPEMPGGVEPLPPTEEIWWTPDENLVETGSDTEDSAEAWWFEDPDEARSSDDGDLLTRTMAELYEKQGLVGEAVAIYKELLEDHPDDSELKAALARAESSFASAPAVAVPAEPEADPLDEASTSTDPEPTPTVSSPVTSGRSEVFLEWLRSLAG